MNVVNNYNFSMFFLIFCICDCWSVSYGCISLYSEKKKDYKTALLSLYLSEKLVPTIRWSNDSGWFTLIKFWVSFSFTVDSWWQLYILHVSHEKFLSFGPDISVVG